MLRIKEEKWREFENKAKELGFVEDVSYEQKIYAYDFCKYTKTISSYLVIYQDNRQLSFDYIDFLAHANKALTFLFDLIMQGYVEKTGE